MPRPPSIVSAVNSSLGRTWCVPGGGGSTTRRASLSPAGGGATPPTPPSDEQRFGPSVAALLQSFETVIAHDPPAPIRRGLVNILSVRDLLREPSPTATEVDAALRAASLSWVVTTEHLTTLTQSVIMVIPGALYAMGRLHDIAAAAGLVTDTGSSLFATAMVTAVARYVQDAPVYADVENVQRWWWLAYSTIPFLENVDPAQFDAGQRRAVGDLLARFGIASAIRSWDWGELTGLDNFWAAAQTFTTTAERAALQRVDLARAHTYFAMALPWRETPLVVIEHQLALLIDTDVSERHTVLERAARLVALVQSHEAFAHRARPNLVDFVALALRSVTH